MDEEKRNVNALIEKNILNEKLPSYLENLKILDLIFIVVTHPDWFSLTKSEKESDNLMFTYATQLYFFISGFLFQEGERLGELIREDCSIKSIGLTNYFYFSIKKENPFALLFKYHRQLDEKSARKYVSYWEKKMIVITEKPFRTYSDGRAS